MAYEILLLYQIAAITKIFWNKIKKKDFDLLSRETQTEYINRNNSDGVPVEIKITTNHSIMVIIIVVKNLYVSLYKFQKSEFQKADLEVSYINRK